MSDRSRWAVIQSLRYLSKIESRFRSKASWPYCSTALTAAALISRVRQSLDVGVVPEVLLSGQDWHSKSDHALDLFWAP